MSSISAANIAIATQIPVSPTAATPASTDTNNAADNTSSYGPAVTVSLSAPAQAIVSAQAAPVDPAASDTASSGSTPQTTATTANAIPSPTSDTAASADTASTDSNSSSSDGTSSSASSAQSPPPPPAGGAGGGGGAGISLDSSDDVDVVKEQVALQVGIVAANELVDKNGNIDRVGLDKLLAQQQQQENQLTGKAS